MLSVSSEQRGLNDPLSVPSNSVPSSNVPLNEPLTRLAGAFKSASGALGEVLMPRTCPCCAVPVAYGSGSPLCEACLPQLHSALGRVERVYVLQPLSSGDCVADRAPEVRAASRYEGIMPRALLALKNAGRTDLLPLLGEGLARSVYELLRAHREELQSVPGSSISSVGFPSAPVEVLLVPAPSLAQSVRRRGYAPANLLVQEAARQLNRRLPASVRVRAVDVIGYAPRGRRGSGASFASRVGASLGASEAKNEQKSLGAVARAERMHGALRVMEPALCAGRLSVICDDVVTTGATASEMVRVLQEAGSRVLGVCAVAAVPKRMLT